jgi:hypothetical protein
MAHTQPVPNGTFRSQLPVPKPLQRSLCSEVETSRRLRPVRIAWFLLVACCSQEAGSMGPGSATRNNTSTRLKVQPNYIVPNIRVRSSHA